MKKTLKVSILSIILGALVGILLNNTYKEKIISTFAKEGNSYYFIQEGVYASNDIMQENTKDILIKTVDLVDNKHYVYLGITRNKENANKLKEIYEKKGYQVYIKEQNLSNEEFYNNVTQFDILIESTDKEEEILTIEEVVLANYEELIKRKNS